MGNGPQHGRSDHIPCLFSGLEGRVVPLAEVGQPEHRHQPQNSEGPHHLDHALDRTAHSHIVGSRQRVAFLLLVHVEFCDLLEHGIQLLHFAGNVVLVTLVHHLIRGSRLGRLLRIVIGGGQAEFLVFQLVQFTFEDGQVGLCQVGGPFAR